MRQRSKERIGGHLMQIRAGADGKEERGERSTQTAWRRQSHGSTWDWRRRQHVKEEHPAPRVKGPAASQCKEEPPRSSEERMTWSELRLERPLSWPCGQWLEAGDQMPSFTCGGSKADIWGPAEMLREGEEDGQVWSSLLPLRRNNEVGQR